MSEKQKWTPEPWKSTQSREDHDIWWPCAETKANCERAVTCVNALADIPDPAAYVRACGECERALEECQGLLDAWASTDNSLSITHLFNQAKVLEGQARTALQSLQKARGK